MKKLYKFDVIEKKIRILRRGTEPDPQILNSGAETTARLIVVVEKDTAFQRLLQVRVVHYDMAQSAPKHN